MTFASLVPILFMYGLCVAALLPFIWWVMHMMTAGDRMREQEANARAELGQQASASATD